jgi:hypothetical protein
MKDVPVRGNRVGNRGPCTGLGYIFRSYVFRPH